MTILNFIKSLTFIFKPRYWFINGEYSAAWDAALNKLIDAGEFKRVGDYCHRLSGKLVWTHNYPYGYGTPYGWAQECRPSRRTIVRLRKAIENSEFNCIVKDAP